MVLLQLSSVHTLKSSHTFVVPAQAPEPWHTSFSVQSSPSSQAFPASGVLLHAPLPASHASTVHGLPSSHTFASPVQLPTLEQTSLVVHALPSSHDCPVFAVFWHASLPSEATHMSDVHALLSLQSVSTLHWQVQAPAAHEPLLHLSPVVQA